MSLEELYKTVMRKHDEAVEKGKAAFQRLREGRHVTADYDIAFQSGQAHAFIDVADMILEEMKNIEKK